MRNISSFITFQLFCVSDSAVLHGAFLSANQLCRPSSLSTLQKPDWIRVGRPVLEAVRQICGRDVTCCWKKKVVCVVWLKLLSREAEEDVETSWRENPFFALQNGLPELSHVVLLELVKSTAAADVFASFLLQLPQSQICVELERLIQFVRSSPVREDDVQLFLDVWWELWKGGRAQTTGGGETIEVMFANQFARLSSQSSGVSPQAAKRLKLDTSDQPPADVLHLLLQALKDMKDHMTSADLCLRAASTSLDSLYTTSLIDKQLSLPAQQKMLMLSKAVRLREKNHNTLSAELVQEAQRDLRASHTPSQFQPSRVKPAEALKLVTDLTQVWLSSGLLTSHDSADYSAFRLQQSLQRVLTALEEPEQEPEVVTERSRLRALMESLRFPDVQTTPEVDVKVAAIIISHRLDDCQDFAALFAGESSWASSDHSWLDCVQQNQVVFQQHDSLLHLASTLMSQLHSRSSDVSRCRKLMKVIADVFSALSLEDKNKALAAMLELSPRGFCGRSAPSAVTDGFEQELNMAFNCIIQGGGGASAAVSQGNLNTAVALVARVAFQSPEAALRSCCHAAIFNKGAFALMAKILQQLPGLRGRTRRRESKPDTDEGEEALSGSTLLCSCLQDVIQAKSLSAGEKEQLLKFLGLLMTPGVEAEGEERRRSFLSPQEVVITFVLPNLCSTSE